MAIVYATKPGNWSDTTVWNTGALPGNGDDVYSNNFTVTIDTSPTVLSISNAAVAAAGVTVGGSFVPTNGITLTCTATNGCVGVVANIGVFNCSLTVGQSCTLRANCSVPTTSSRAAVNSGAGTLNVIGNCFSTNLYSYTIHNSGTGTTNITGNCFSSGGQTQGINTAALCDSGALNITGDCTGGEVRAHGAYNAGGNLTITGNCNGGNGSSGVSHAGGTTVIIGSCGGGTVYGGWGAQNSVSTGSLTIIGAITANAINPGLGLGVATQVTYLTGPLLCYSTNDASAGVNPCIALRWFPADTALGTFLYEMRGATASGSPSVRPARQMFLTDAYSSGYPSTSLVRSGVSYGPGSIYSGIAAIPPRESVSYGVPVDNSTGLAAFLVSDFWKYPVSDITTPGSIGERLKTSATVNVVGKLISDSFSVK